MDTFHAQLLNPRATARFIPIALLLALAACGGSSSTSDPTILPDGPDDPRAYTEQFLSRNPGAVLRPGLMAILTLEPTRGDEDTGAWDGVDVVNYHFDAAVELGLAIDSGAERVGALVLKDARGRELIRVASGSASVRLDPGHHALEVHHAQAGDPSAPGQVVFLRPDGAGTGLAAASNCVACSFDQSTLDNQSYDGLDLSQSTFALADVENSTFTGANLSSTRWTAATLRNVTFTSATMGQVDFSSYTSIPTAIFSSDFRGADLDGGNFDHTEIYDTMFGDTDPAMAANLTDTTWSADLGSSTPCEFTILQLVDFRNVDLSGASFFGTDMMGVDFSGATATGVDLTGSTAACALLSPPRPLVTTCDPNCVFGLEPTSGRSTDLSNAIFTAAAAPGVQLQGMALAGVKLSGAVLSGGDFDGLDFSNSDLGGADLTDAQLNGANLQGATLTGAMLTGVQLNGANLSGVDLQGLGMAQAQVQNVDLFERNLQQIDLSGAQLVGTNFDYSDLSDANLSGAVLGVPTGSTTPPASLEGAYMPNVDLSFADLRNVSLSYAHLYGDQTKSNLTGAILDGAKLDHSICSGSRFTMASMVGVDLSQAQLVDCTFDDADLTDASFDTAYLEGADFSGAARLDGASLFNAAVATMAGVWTYDEGGMPVTYQFGPTVLGGFASLAGVTCPNGQDGPCTGVKLTPVRNGPFPPQPTCVPTPPTYDNCTAPTPTPTPPPALSSIAGSAR